MTLGAGKTDSIGEAATTAVSPPEPDLGPEEIIERARALRPLLVEQQAATEENGLYSEEIHQAFLDAGFYRMLVPRRYGGYEFDIPTFARVIIEIARGCPSTGWSLCLPTGHCLQIGSWFEETAQAETFGDGDCRIPAVAAPWGTARRAPGGEGWILNGTHRYCSGAPYATHYLGQTLVEREPGDTESPTVLLFLARRGQWTMLDDWGDVLGLRGSGSHSIRFDDALVPAHLVMENTMMVDVEVSGGTPGSRLHGNPMYAGRAPSFYAIEMGALAVGMARGALDEYEQIIRTRHTQRPPVVHRYLDPDYQRWYGTAAGNIEAAEAMLLQCAEQYMEACRANVSGGPIFGPEEDLRLNIIGREVIKLAWRTVSEDLYGTAGTGAAHHGQRMERIFRDLAMARGHYLMVMGDWSAREYGRLRLGIAADPAPPE